MVTGYALERRYVGFPVRVSPWKQAVKVIIGLVVLLALRMGPPLRQYTRSQTWKTLMGNHQEMSRLTLDGGCDRMYSINRR